MDDIGEWLALHGLAEYEEIFHRERIEFRDLRVLTEDDARELGLPLGPRRRLLTAIADLRSQDPHTESSGGRPAATGGGPERRQLTVMFADLVGSTALAERLDPEALSDVIRRYQAAARTAIVEYGGYVARYMGDGVLAYFGYPTAAEDDAERAVRAGLLLVDEVPRLPADVELAVRVGIATGQVVVGELVGEGDARERTAVGGTPNLAARAQGEAPANAVVIAESTRELVAGLFDCDDLGIRTLKGFEHPPRLWRVLGERESASRFEAMHSRALTSFVGRAAELGLLAERWRNARDGEGQVIAISGEPGIGKSRLAIELRRATESDKRTALRFQCSPFHTHSAFHPFVEQLRRAARLLPQDDAGRALEKLACTLAGSEAERSRALEAFAGLLSLSSARLLPRELSPQARKAEIVSALRGQMAALCERRPVLALFEDAHWADPTSLEVLDALVDEARGQCALIVVTHRPEFSSRWLAHGHVSELRMSRLTHRDGAAIVAEVANERALPESVVAQILEKTDGVPLFVEELTKTVLESSGTVEATGGNVLGGLRSEAAIPSTLRDSLMARLDYLGPGKEVAQVAACIGRDFNRELLAAVSDCDGDGLSSALDRLVEHQIVFERGSGVFTFKHALLQDAAYDSLLLTRRARIHELIVSVIEARHGGDVTEVAELLAYHCKQAGSIEKAVHYCRLAGEKSNERSAYREALQFLEDGLALARSLAPSDEVTREAINIRLAMRGGLGALGHYEKLLGVLSEAKALANSVGDDETAAAASIQETHVLYHLGRLDEAIDEGENAVALATRSGRRPRIVGANAYLAMAHFFRGNLRKALDIALPDAEELRGRYRHETLETTATSSINWLHNLSGMLAMVGEFDAALSFGEDALAIAEETQRPFDSAMARMWPGFVLCTMGEAQAAIERLEPALATATSHQLDFQLPWVSAKLGYAYALAGDAERACETLSSGRERARALGLVLIRILSTAWLGYAEREAGRLGEARAHAEEALRDSRACRFAWAEVLSLRYLACALADSNEGDPGQPEALWRDAIAIATRCGATPYGAKARLELGEYLSSTGRTDEARALIESASAEFSRMGMRRWLERAAVTGQTFK